MKWHSLIDKTEAGEKIVLLCRLIEAAEDVWVETSIDDITVNPEKHVIYLSEERIPSEKLKLLREKYLSYGILIETGEGPLSYRDLYFYLKDTVISSLSSYLSKLLNRTSSVGKEHALLLLPGGELLLLEGEKGRVTLPEIRAYVFAHTHPTPGCLPSKTDLGQTASFFMSGGYVNLIVSSLCISVFYKKWLLGEDDILALKELERNIDKIYKKSGNPIIDIKKALEHTYIGFSLETL